MTACSVADGWYVVKASLVGTLENCQVVYAWSSDEPYPNPTRAVSAGWEAHGHDDWNLVWIKDGAVAWFGWMDEAFPHEEWQEVADALGVPVGKDRSRPEVCACHNQRACPETTACDHHSWCDVGEDA